MEHPKPCTSSADEVSTVTDFELCIICQNKTLEEIVTPKSEESYRTVIRYVTDRANYCEEECVTIKSRMQPHLQVSELVRKNTKYHRTCYQRTCHAGHRDRARKRFSDAIQSKNVTMLKGKKGRPSSPVVQIEPSLRRRSKM